MAVGGSAATLAVVLRRLVADAMQPVFSGRPCSIRGLGRELVLPAFQSSGRALLRRYLHVRSRRRRDVRKELRTAHEATHLSEELHNVVLAR